VEINVVGDVPWAKMTYDNDLARGVDQMFATFGTEREPRIPHESILGGYWPAYLFAGDVMNIPIAGGAVGMGGNAHAANEYIVIEGAGRTFGYAGTEKSIATALFNYAGLNKPAQ
jgi:hypothetical protein